VTSVPTTSATSTRRPADDSRPTPVLGWWREVIVVVAFYLVYSLIRNRYGSAAVGPDEAFANTQRVIGIEQHLGLFHEQAVQSWFAGWHAFIVFWNTFYGTLHFVVPIATLVFVLVRWPSDYRLVRNTLAFTTAFALVGFSLFPVMPPRLLCDCTFGAGAGAAHFGFIDTMVTDGGLWSFGSSGVSAVSNQYAAMPSLHVAWALWCALALVPRLRPRSLRWLAGVYPALTLFAVLVTGNHFFLDALGGAAVVAAGWWAGSVCTGWTENRRRTASREDLTGVLVAQAASGVPLETTSDDHCWTAGAGRPAMPADREIPPS
jgi:hypothetical protein